tara:strand:+ start:62 stop:799 length:738 start_codon:yes stop_codon:yes gene_type:complete
MFRYIVISNETETVRQVTYQLSNFPDFICLNITSNFDEASNVILKESPDLIFLDLDMRLPDMGCFEFVNQLFQYTDHLPNFVGLSESKEMAYLTIKNDFVDYILKPVSEFEMRKCMLRFKKKASRQISRLCLKNNSDYHYIDIDDILYLQADNNTTDIFLNTGNKIAAFETLKRFQEKLPKFFIRIHNSYIINSQQINRINFGKSKISLYANFDTVNLPFSRKYKDSVKVFNDNMISGQFSTVLN